MRICVIGSSHISSLKQGWDLASHHFPGHDLVFFGSIGTSIRHLRAVKGRLVTARRLVNTSFAMTSGGCTFIDPQDYDAFLIYGLQLWVPRLERGISVAVMKEVVSTKVASSLTVQIAKLLRALSDKVIWVSPAPLETAPNGVHDSENFHSYAALIDEMAASIAVPGTKLLGQPSQTLCPDLRTVQGFGTGSVRLKVRAEATGAAAAGAIEHPAHETKHMNGDYGAVWLRQNLPAIVAT